MRATAGLQLVWRPRIRGFGDHFPGRETRPTQPDHGDKDLCTLRKNSAGADGPGVPWSISMFFAVTGLFPRRTQLAANLDVWKAPRGNLSSTALEPTCRHALCVWHATGRKFASTRIVVPRCLRNAGMRRLLSGVRITGGVIVPAVILVAAFVVASGMVKLPWKTDAAEKQAEVTDTTGGVELVAGKPNSLLVPEDVRKSLGIRKGNVDQIAVAEKPTRTRPLVMPGSTALDPARLIRVRVRFAPAEVVEIAEINDPHSLAGKHSALGRDFQAGDPVKKGDLLAVLFSVDVGNKKNDLFDALSQLRLDEEVLKRAEAQLGGRAGSLPAQCPPQRRSRHQRRQPGREHAEDLGHPRGGHSGRARRSQEDHRRPKTGTPRKGTAEAVGPRGTEGPRGRVLIEQNVALHETVVDNTTNLFQIAKVDPLVVLAAVPEDDLPALQELKSQSHDLLRLDGPHGRSRTRSRA